MKQTLKEKIHSCTRCGLCEVGHGPVSYRGKPSTILIVGEAPGKKEDEIGRNFVGPSGQLLWSVLNKYGITNKDVMVANAVCCYPSRTPTESEVYACRSNFYAQVKYCNPKHILALGKTANMTLGTLLGPNNRRKMIDIRGNWYQLGWFSHDVLVFPTIHPAAVLRKKEYTRGWTKDIRIFAGVVLEAQS